ncbi:MAG: acyl carrier protein [Lachnospiraceae bacterium]|nr:acyl carrier protein [Lachnospiraceae bacterium]
MSNLELYKKAFVNVFEVSEEDLGDAFTSDACEKWDSVSQMALVTELENAFDIMIDIDDIYELNSFNAGIEILKKYEVEI